MRSELRNDRPPAPGQKGDKPGGGTAGSGSFSADHQAGGGVVTVRVTLVLCWSFYHYSTYSSENISSVRF